MEIRDWECDVVYDLLPLYMDGKAGEDSRTFVKEHLQKCRGCKEVYEDMQRIQESSSTEELQETISSQKEQKVFAKLRRRFFLALIFYIIVIIALGIIFAWFLFR